MPRPKHPGKVMAGGVPTVERPPATAPPLTASDQLSQAWRLAGALPDREREELHRRLTATLPVVVTAEPVSSGRLPTRRLRLPLVGLPHLRSSDPLIIVGGADLWLL